MSSNETQPVKSSRRRYIILVALLVLVVAGWSAAWFYGRSFLSGQLDQQMDRMAQQGLEISCGDLAINGYPFRYEVSCRQMSSADRFGAAASLGGLDAVALIYNPRHVIFEAQAPAALEIPISGVAGDMTWDTARASVKFTQDALGELDAVIGKPEAVLENPVSSGTFAADKAEFHLRQSPEIAGTLDGFASVNGLLLKSVPQLTDAVNLRAQLQIEGGAVLLSGANLAQAVQINGGELPVKLALFDATFGNSRVAATGDLVVNGDGTFSGTLDFTIGNAEAVLEALKPLVPPEDRTLPLVEQVVKSLEPAATEVDGVKTIPLLVDIDHGIARIGFLPLPPIPPLFQAGI